MSTFSLPDCLEPDSLTLQPAHSSTARDRKNSGSLAKRNGVRMAQTSLQSLWRTIQPGAALGHAGDGNRKTPADGDFTEQSLDRAELGNRGAGVGAEVVLHLGKIGGQIRVSHCDHDSFGAG